MTLYFSNYFLIWRLRIIINIKYYLLLIKNRTTLLQTLSTLETTLHWSKNTTVGCILELQPSRLLSLKSIPGKNSVAYFWLSEFSLLFTADFQANFTDMLCNSVLILDAIEEIFWQEVFSCCSRFLVVLYDVFLSAF